MTSLRGCYSLATRLILFKMSLSEDSTIEQIIKNKVQKSLQYLNVYIEDAPPLFLIFHQWRRVDGN